MHNRDFGGGMVDARDGCNADFADCKSRATNEDIDDAVGLSSAADSACRAIGELAVKALLYELNTTPKPGLVDRENNGAHADMNYQMFRASANALRECFEDCARAGIESVQCAEGLQRAATVRDASVSDCSADENFGVACRSLSKDVESKSQISDWDRIRNAARVMFEPSKELLEFRLRRIGLAGERKMFRVTGGVNTHKGLIFSLGIICAACGVIASESHLGNSEGTSIEPLEAFEHLESLSNFVEIESQIGDAYSGLACNPIGRIDARDLQQKCVEISRKVLEVGRTTENTHGNTVYAKTGIYGAKGEALSGFATAFDVGLPVLRNALKAGLSGNDAMVVTLLYLMTVTDDSNIVYRGGLDGLKFVKEKSRLLIDCDFDIESVRSFDRECIERNLSPGGSADLLAVTAMLHMITKSES